jgi:hypothetical protein
VTNRMLPPVYEPFNYRASGEWSHWLTYAIRATHTGLIKIGRCHLTTEDARFRSAEKLIGERCDWLGYLDVDETFAHRKLGEWWVWREWFEPADEVVDYILPLLRQTPPRRAR